MYMQDVIRTLNSFWLDKGCLLWQPYHAEVGAGTSNPATFLRVLGPEPWWTAYVEPSTRPDDGRYAENPNRLQHYYQYQVILKPSPPDVQELYLQSLEALGLDLKLHDYRFVEDNWESPSLGAWGLGWEAWLDGMEILQFTYFQECGGLRLNVRACELTYGVERICMYLQEKESVFDLDYAPGVSYGDIFKASEIEYCKYNFEAADTDRLLQLFETYETEGLRLVEEGIVMPAYDHCLRLSHLFNLLDARGALSVTERGRFLLRCRALSERCAKGFYAQREEMGFPMARGQKQPPAVMGAAPNAGETLRPDKPDTLLIEVGVEELPHGDIEAALEQAPALMANLLEERRLTHGPMEVFAAPRRIALRIADVAPGQETVEREARGPKAGIAKDDAGNWSVPAQRFAEGQGATVDDIYFKKQGKAEYCFVKVVEAGRNIAELAGEIVAEFIGGLRFRKAMGWEDSTAVFSRPVRWLVALHGESVLPVKWRLREEDDLGPTRYIQAGRTTYAHRRLAYGDLTIANPAGYLDILRGHYVLADRKERLQSLKEGVQAIAREQGLHIAAEDEDLYEEVCDLVEFPEPILCSIPGEALELPEPVIITPMKVHQRYFPLRDAQGTLSRHFIAVANGDHQDVGRTCIGAGNEKVLNARLRDARYFWETDRKTPLRGFAQELPRILFHQKLGSLADKVARLETLAGKLNDRLPDVDDAKLRETLQLMKADLATQMVGEFSSLEGVMGMLYAKEEGLDDAVATAIFEHRLPRRAGDALPETPLGLAAALLDRLDTLAGYFGIGVKVKGTSDPFGLRRNALALLTLARANGLDLDLRVCLRAAVDNYGETLTKPDGAVEAALAFIGDRLDVMAREAGYAYDLAAAALAAHGHAPAAFWSALEALAELSPAQQQDLAEQAKRIERIAKEPAGAIDPALLDDSEKALWEIVDGRASTAANLVEQRDFRGAFAELLTWTPVIARYFEEVLVNAEDDAVRMNRHALLRAAGGAMTQAADLTRIEKRQLD